MFFMFYCLFSFVSLQIVVVIHFGSLLLGNFRVPSIWMGAHFLLLCFAVMVVMGAMYQLVPVAFLTPIWNQTFGFIQLIVTVIGFTSFTFLLGFAPNKAIYSGSIALVGVLMFLLQMFLTIRKQENKNIMTAFVLSALVCFFLTIVAGGLLAWNLAFGTIAIHQPIFYSHLAFGITGWFTLLIFAFSYKLVPMFSLSHGFSMKGAKPAFFTYIAGLITLICSFWTEAAFMQTLGWALLLTGFVFFVIDVREILKKRLRRKLDKP